jgi:hypothetical protein
MLVRLTFVCLRTIPMLGCSSPPNLTAVADSR